MTLKASHRTRIFFFFIALFLLGCTLQAHAVLKEDPSNRETPPLSSTTQAQPPSEPVSYWRSFLWEAFPADWLRDSRQSTLLDCYQQHQWQPFFITSRFQLSEGAHLLLDRIEKLEADAIDPKPYQLAHIRKSIANLDQTRQALQAVDPNFQDSLAGLGDTQPSENLQAARTDSPPARVATDSPQPVLSTEEPAHRKDKEHKYRNAFRAASELDIRLAHDLIRLAHDLDPFSAELQTKVLTGQITMAEFIKDIEPSSPQYEALRQAYEKLLHPVYQERSQQESSYTGKSAGAHQAHAQLQHGHNPASSAAAGRKTKEASGPSNTTKIRMIAMSMRALRQSATRIHESYIRINIPQFMLEYYRDGKLADTHRVIVGKAKGKKVKLMGQVMGENHTPTLSSYIENVILNPRWYLTDRIKRELYAAFASDPAYFAKHGYVTAMAPGGSHRLFQLPGPTNPLGRVKFEFANGYAVFLHDTPNKRLFARSRRDFSHGCVRVEGALKLARLVLQDDQNPAADKTESYLESNRQTYIKLQHPLPIIIEYVPVVVNAKGQLTFLGDPYGLLDESSANS